MKELGHAVQEIEYLGDKEEQRRFAEVANYADHSERHSREVAERVAHEDPRRIPETHRGFFFCEAAVWSKEIMRVYIECALCDAKI